MTERMQVYKCRVCGNIVEMLHEGVGKLVCCGAPMDLFEEKMADEGKEKHVPVVEKVDGGFKVTVGSVPHPMEEDHHIEWVQIIANGKSYRQFLKPGQEPSAVIKVDADQVSAREYCSIHGLWKG